MAVARMCAETLNVLELFSAIRTGTPLVRPHMFLERRWIFELRSADFADARGKLASSLQFRVRAAFLTVSLLLRCCLVAFRTTIGPCPQNRARHKFLELSLGIPSSSRVSAFKVRIHETGCDSFLIAPATLLVPYGTSPIQTKNCRHSSSRPA